MLLKFIVAALCFISVIQVVVGDDDDPDDIDPMDDDVDPDGEELEETWDQLEKSPSSGRAVRYECPWPFNLIAGSCVHASLSNIYNSYDWETARKYCLALDGDLASFGDLKELLLLVGYMRVNGNMAHWIGARRHNTTGLFMWLNGRHLPEIESPLWEYQSDADHDCVSLKIVGDTYKLRNYDCRDNRHIYSQWCKLS